MRYAWVTEDVSIRQMVKIDIYMHLNPRFVYT